MDRVELQLPKTLINEGSAFTATVRFRDSATKAASVPTTAEYKLWNTNLHEEIRDWTTLTPAASIDIPVVAADNAIESKISVIERVEFLVVADRGLATQVSEAAYYSIKNLGGIDG